MVKELLAQRIFGIALGYEDLNDHEDLRHDPLLAVAVGKNDPSPPGGFALAGKSTLNRLERSCPICAQHQPALKSEDSSRGARRNGCVRVGFAFASRPLWYSRRELVCELMGCVIRRVRQPRTGYPKVSAPAAGA
jgi:hypothetical protein